VEPKASSPPSAVENREREHAAQSLEQPIDPPGLVAAQDELGVRAGAERLGRAQSGRRPLPVIDLAVVDDPDVAARVRHRLVGERPRVDDRQARVQQAIALPELRVLRVGPARRERGLHGARHLAGHRALREEAADSAHG
jgi:hypothetical protein